MVSIRGARAKARSAARKKIKEYKRSGKSYSRSEEMRKANKKGKDDSRKSRSSSNRDYRQARQEAARRGDIRTASDLRKVQSSIRRDQYAKAQTILDRVNQRQFAKPGGMSTNAPSQGALSFAAPTTQIGNRTILNQTLPSMQNITNIPDQRSIGQRMVDEAKQAKQKIVSQFQNPKSISDISRGLRNTLVNPAGFSEEQLNAEQQRRLGNPSLREAFSKDSLMGGAKALGQGVSGLGKLASYGMPLKGFLKEKEPVGMASEWLAKKSQPTNIKEAVSQRQANIMSFINPVADLENVATKIPSVASKIAKLSKADDIVPELTKLGIESKKASTMAKTFEKVSDAKSIEGTLNNIIRNPVKSLMPSGKSIVSPKTRLPQQGMAENIVENQGRVPYTTNQAYLPEGVKRRGFGETVKKSELVPKELFEQIDDITYQVKSNKETLSRVKAIQELGEDNALRVARDANHPESNAVALKLMEDALKKNEFEKFTMLNKEFSPRFTKQGQQIQIISKFGKLTPTGAVRFAKHIVEEANKLSGSKIKLTDDVIRDLTGLAEDIAKAPEGRKKVVAIAKLMDKIAAQVPQGLGKKVATLQTMAQLLNPKTAIRNILGNVALGATETVSDIAGTGIDKLLSKIVPGWERSMGLPSVGKMYEGAKRGFKLGMEDALLGIDTSGIGTKFDLPTRTFRKGLMDKIEKAMNIELRATDRAFYQAAFDDSINSMMKATKSSKITQEMMAQAGEEALYRTFQNNSKLASAMVKLKKGLNFGKEFGIGDLINKYPKTPANIVNVGMDYSPIGALKTIRQIYDATKGITSIGNIATRRNLVKQISRTLVGTGIIATGYVLAKNGILSGKSEKDKDIRALQRESGEGPFRINISAIRRLMKREDGNPKNGDLLVSYDWLQPNAIPFSMGVNMALGNKKAEEALNAAIEGLESGVDTLTQQPVIQGIKRFGEDFSNKGIVRAIGNQLAEAPASFVPTIINQLRQKFGDNIQKETYDPNIFKEGLNRAMAKVPGLENKLPQRIDTLGKPAETYQGGTNSVVNVFFNPAFVSRIEESPEAKMVLDLYRTTGEQGQIPRVAPEFIKDENGNRIDLTPEQYTQFQKYIGEKTQEMFSKLAQSDEFNSMNDVDKVNKLTSLLTNISADAKKEIMGVGQGSGKADEAFIKYTELKGLSDEEFFNRMEEMKKAGGDQEAMVDTIRKYRASDTAREMGFDTVDEWSNMSVPDRGRAVEEKMQNISQDDRARLFNDMIRRDLVSEQLMGDIVKRKLITAEKMMTQDIEAGTKARVLYEEIKNKTGNFFDGDPDRQAKLDDIQNVMQDMVVNGLRSMDMSVREKEQQMETIKTEFKAFLQDDRARENGLANDEERWSKLGVNERAIRLVDKVWGMEKPQAEETLNDLAQKKLVTEEVQKEFKYQWKKRVDENKDQILKAEEDKQALYDEAAGLIQRKIDGETLTDEEEQKIAMAMESSPQNLETPSAMVAPAGFQPAGTMRTDRNNNPTAFTTDVAKSMGLVEGVDYVQGDKFPGDSNLYTAKLLGDPIETTIKGLDQGGFYTQSGKPRWSYVAMSDEEWHSLSKEEKTLVIAKMYAMEGGNGNLMNSPSSQYAMTPQEAQIVQAVGTGQMPVSDAVDTVLNEAQSQESVSQIPTETEPNLTTIPTESRTSAWLAQQNYPYWQSSFNIYYLMGMVNKIYTSTQPGQYAGMPMTSNYQI